MHELGAWARSEILQVDYSWDNSPVIASPEAQQDGSSWQSIKIHQCKMQPPTLIGECGTFKRWNDKFQACMSLMDNKLPRLMESSEISTTIIQGSDLIVGVAIEEINKWIRRSTDLRSSISTKRLWDLQATLYQVLSSIWEPKALVISPSCCWMGVWAQQVRTLQQTGTTKTSQNGSHTEWDKTDPYKNIYFQDKHQPMQNWTQQVWSIYCRATRAFTKLKQKSSSVSSSNQGGVLASMDIWELSKGSMKGVSFA